MKCFNFISKMFQWREGKLKGKLIYGTQMFRRRGEIPGKLIVLSGPLTVADRLTLESSFERVVTTTTRVPRGNEKDGVDYHFLTDGEFADAIEEGLYLSYAQVDGDWYGTPIQDIDSGLVAGKFLLLIIDIQEARQIREWAQDRTWCYYDTSPGGRYSCRVWRCVDDCIYLKGRSGYLRGCKKCSAIPLISIILFEQFLEGTNPYDHIIINDNKINPVAKNIIELVTKGDLIC